MNQLVTAKLTAEAENIRAEGWAFVEHAIDFPWNHRSDFRAIAPLTPALTEKEAEDYDNLALELDEFEAAGEENWSNKDRKRAAQLKAKLAEYDARIPVYSEEQKAKAGAFVTIDQDGQLLIGRGYRRLADLAAEQHNAASHSQGPANDEAQDYDALAGTPHETGELQPPPADDDSAELPDRLMTQLTAYHSLGLRNALAENHRAAYLAMLHALTLRLFYTYNTNSCLQIEAKDTLLPPFPGLSEFKAARDIAARHEDFQKLLPDHESKLWNFLFALDDDKQQELFAHCVGLTVNALHEPWARSNKRRHARQLAEALKLDMADQGFVITAENYLSRIKKQQIIETVAEAMDQQTADLLCDLKKTEMAKEAERLLQGTGWLPPILKTHHNGDEPMPGAAPAVPAFLEDALMAAE